MASIISEYLDTSEYLQQLIFCVKSKEGNENYDLI